MSSDPTSRRFSEEWNGAGDRVEDLVAAFNIRLDLLRRAGASPDSAVLSYEDGSGTWSIVATITLEVARAMGYRATDLQALEQQEIFD